MFTAPQQLQIKIYHKSTLALDISLARVMSTQPTWCMNKLMFSCEEDRMERANQTDRQG